MDKKKMKPKVSIYMVAYNAEKYISQAIYSVLAQTYRDFELLIVDDGSTDKTAGLISTIDSVQLDDRIRHIHQEHKNFASGMNRAIKEAKGEYILGVDADDFIDQNYLQIMVDFADKYPDIDYFYPARLVLVDEQGEQIGQWKYVDFLDNRKLETFLLEQEYNPIPNPGSLKRKSMFDRVGLYDEVETCEDFAFLCKNALKIKFKRVDKCSAYFYRRLPNSNSQKTEAREKVHTEALKQMQAADKARTGRGQGADKPRLLICSPWDNCWLRYFKKYFGKNYDVRIHQYKHQRYDTLMDTESCEAVDWADIVIFNWCDPFTKFWSHQKKRKRGKKFIAFLRSYEIWDTNVPWQINWSNIDHLIFVNPLIQQCFLDNVPANIDVEFKTPTCFIPNAIDLDEWKFVDRKPNRKIAWINDLCYKKGVQLLAQFAFQMPYNYSILPAGRQGDTRTAFYFNYITHAMRVNTKIAPIKRYNDVQGFLEDKSFALCTSIVEGHPNALLEAMATGIKPIIHNWPGALSLYPEKYVYNTIEEAVEMLKGDYDSREYRNFVEERYDMNRIYPQIEKLF